MATASPDDRLRAKAAEDPALAVACKRIAALEGDIANLRRGMVQQLTTSGKLMKAVFALDNDYFGGRFQGQTSQDGMDPFRDITVATHVVEAVSEELQGVGAFADSPVLRDGIANLVAALEAVRSIALKMEETGIEAVGLPVKAGGFPPRTFPENNPPGCLAELAGFVRDLSGVLTRTRDRFSAMRMLIAEAERARSEAESTVEPVNADQVAAAVTGELRSVEAELADLRARFLAEQDQQAALVDGLRGELDAAREALAAEADGRAADRAEARSLAAEIARLIAETPEASSDDLEITLAVLRDALTEDQDMAAVIAATEEAVIDWIRHTGARQRTQEEELARLRAAPAAPAGESPAAAALIARLAEREGALADTRAKLAQAEALGRDVDALRTRLADASRIAQAQGDELQRLRGEQAAGAELATRLAQAEAAATSARAQAAAAASALAERDAQLARLSGDAAGAAARLQELQRGAEAARAQQQAHAELDRSADALRTQLATAQAAIAQRDAELLRVTESAASEKRKRTDSERAAQGAGEQRQQLAAALGDLQSVRHQVGGLTATLASRDGEMKQLREARDAAEAKLAQAEQAARAKDAARGGEVAEVRKTLAAVEGRLDESAKGRREDQAELVRLRAENARLGAELTKATANLDFTAARERQLGTERERGERERAELQARLDALRKTHESVSGQSEQSLSQSKRQLAELRAAETEAQAQLARATTAATALGERSGALEKEVTALRAERDRLAAGAQASEAELAKLRARSAELDGERTRLASGASGAEERIRNLAQEVERLRSSESDTAERAERVAAELAQVRAKLAQTLAAREQNAAEQAAWQEMETQLIRDRDVARASASSTAGERDRLRASLERAKLDQEAIARRLEERESQLTARLAETSRQLGEHKQLNSRLAAEGERMQAELTRYASQPRDAVERKDTTGTWTRRLADSAADTEAARLRIAELEHLADEQRHHLAHLEEQAARLGQSEAHLRERVGEVERRESAVQQAFASAKADADTTHARLTAVERELAAERVRLQELEASRARQRQRFDALMREARDAVANAKVRQEQADADDRQIIGELKRQIDELRMRTGTRGA